MEHELTPDASKRRICMQKRTCDCEESRKNDIHIRHGSHLHTEEEEAISSCHFPLVFFFPRASLFFKLPYLFIFVLQLESLFLWIGWKKLEACNCLWRRFFSPNRTK